MKVAAVTKFKQGDIYAAMKKLGWNQSELARRAGMQAGVVGRILNMNKRPSEYYAKKIQRAFGEAGVFLDVLSVWPSEFQGFDKAIEVEQIKDVAAENLLNLSDSLDKEQTLERLNEAMGTLPVRHREALKLRFFEEKTLNQIGARFKITSERARTLVESGIRRLQHPMRLNYIAGEENETNQILMRQKLAMAQQ